MQLDVTKMDLADIHQESKELDDLFPPAPMDHKPGYPRTDPAFVEWDKKYGARATALWQEACRRYNARFPRR